MHPDNDNYFRPNFVDVYYVNRPAQMQNMCLNYVLEWYDVKDTKPANPTTEYIRFQYTDRVLLKNADDTARESTKVVTKYFHRKKKKSAVCILNMPESIKDEDTFKRAIYISLQRFVPHYHETEIMAGATTMDEYQARYNEMLEQNEYLRENDSLLKSKQQTDALIRKWVEEAEKEAELDRQEEQEIDEEDMTLAEIRKSVIKSKKIQDQNFIQPPETVSEMTSKEYEKLMTPQQRQTYDYVINKIVKNQENGSKWSPENNANEPLRMFLTGKAGTGKSFLTKAICQKVEEIFNPNKDKKVLLKVGSTGISAYQVGGVTAHSAFKLHVRQPGQSAYQKPLSNVDCQSFRIAYKDVVLVIIDEISMLGSTNMAQINSRLEEMLPLSKEAQACDELSDNWRFFGSLNFILVGDFLQLPPVKARYAFERVPYYDAMKVLNCNGVIDQFNHFEYHELTVQMRQSNDQPFTETLNQIRLGNVTEAAFQMLKSRIVDLGIPWDCSHPQAQKRSMHALSLYLLRKLQQEPGSIVIFGLKAQTEAFNKAVTKELGIKTHSIKALDFSKLEGDKPIKTVTRFKSSNETGGLATTLNLGINSRVMLLKNLFPDLGLVNGVQGYVTRFAIVRRKIEKVYVKFDDIDDEVEIERCDADFQLRAGYLVHRKQFPLMLSFAITVHKSQGLTLSHVIVDLKYGLHADGLAYVALSRARSIKNIDLLGLNVSGIRCSIKCVQKYNELRKKSGLPIYEKYNIKDPKVLDEMAKKNPNKRKVNIDVTVPVPVKKRRKSKVPKTTNAPKVVDDQQPSTSTAVPDNQGENIASVLRFVNDGCNCYANSTNQCLLSLPMFRAKVAQIYQNRQALDIQQTRQIDALMELCQKFQRTDPRPVLSAEESNILRFSLNDLRFRTQSQWCASEYMEELLGNFQDLKSYFTMDVFSTYTCASCLEHNVEPPSSHEDINPNKLYYDVQKPDKNHTIQQAVASRAEVGECPRCPGQGDRGYKRFVGEIKISLHPTTQYFVLHINPFGFRRDRCTSKIINFDKNAVHTFPLIENETFRLEACIYHRGIRSDSGHYIAYYRHEQLGWLELDCVNGGTAFKCDNIDFNEVAYFFFKRL